MNGTVEECRVRLQTLLLFSHNAQRHRQTDRQTDRQTTLSCQQPIILRAVQLANKTGRNSAGMSGDLVSSNPYTLFCQGELRA